jgi:hypothetical protein
MPQGGVAATNSRATANQRPWLPGSMNLNRPLQGQGRRAGETPALRVLRRLGLGLRDGFAFVEAGPVVEGGEGAG